MLISQLYLFLSGMFMRVTFRTNVLPSSSSVSKRLDSITSVTEREILERKTQLLRCIRFIHLDRVSEHFERPPQQKDIFTRVVWLLAHPSFAHSKCIPLLRLVIGSFIISPLGSDTNNVRVCYCPLRSKDVSTIHAS